MPAGIVWISSQAGEALAPIFGLRNFNLHAIINDTSGQLQREAWRRYKQVMRLERRRLRRVEIEKRLWRRDMRKLYKACQVETIQAGHQPGLPPPSWSAK